MLHEVQDALKSYAELGPAFQPVSNELWVTGGAAA
jgi:hypothetical protein